MLLTQSQTDELCKFAYLADREARSDLVRGHIRDEDDYTSNFTGALRRIVNSNSQTGLTAVSYMLSTSLERTTGSDATIIFTRRNESKITIFEAKLPGLNSGKTRWDWRQTAGGDSHFSDQLARQSQVNSQISVFEMFYCDYPLQSQPSYMKDEVSSCVWHDDAANFDKRRSRYPNIWKKDELIDMLKSGNKQTNEVLRTICECDSGDRVNIGDEGDVIAGEFGLEGHILQIRATDEENRRTTR